MFFRTDNSSVYTSKEAQEYYKSQRIMHQTSAHYNPQMNAVAERYNRVILETAKAMLCYAGLPKAYWGKAVTTANYIRNRKISKSIDNVTPYELWYRRAISVKHFRIFGCRCYSYMSKQQRNKLGNNSRRCLFLG